MTPLQRNIDCAALLALVTLLAAPLAMGQASLPAIQPIDSIRDSAVEFVRERLTTGDSVVLHPEAGALDARLRLPACAQAMKAFSPSGELRAASRLTIGVRCNSPLWTVYVPVNVESELDVLVTTQALPRNAALTARDVQLQRRRVPGVPAGYLASMEQLNGRHLRAAVAPGSALAVDLFLPDVLVRRGQRVTLVASAGTLEVRAQGEAIADATPDGRVRVINLASRRIVEGQVEGRDSVRISL